MNERIRELFQEAIDYADKTHTYTPEEGFNIQVWDKIRFEKFAELIVAECMSIIKQGEGLGEEDDFDKGFQAGIAMAYNRVRTQMGVEE